MNEKLLTVKELANVLNVNTETIYRDVKSEKGKIPFHKIGNRYKFLLSDVLAATKTEKERKDER